MRGIIHNILTPAEYEKQRAERDKQAKAQFEKEQQQTQAQREKEQQQIHKKRQQAEVELQKEFAQMQKIAELIITEDLLTAMTTTNDCHIRYCFYFRNDNNYKFRQLFQHILQPFELYGWYFDVKYKFFGDDFKTISPNIWARFTYPMNIRIEISFSPTPFKVSFFTRENEIYTTPIPKENTTTPSTIKSTLSQKPKLFVSEQCVICLDQPAKYYFQKCSHLCVCNKCRTDKCPLCRESSKTIRNKS